MGTKKIFLPTLTAREIGGV